jgi:hypothetical protein
MHLLVSDPSGEDDTRSYAQISGDDAQVSLFWAPSDKEDGNVRMTPMQKRQST